MLKRSTPAFLALSAFLLQSPTFCRAEEPVAEKIRWVYTNTDFDRRFTVYDPQTQRTRNIELPAKTSGYLYEDSDGKIVLKVTAQLKADPDPEKKPVVTVEAVSAISGPTIPEASTILNPDKVLPEVVAAAPLVTEPAETQGDSVTVAQDSGVATPPPVIHRPLTAPVEVAPAAVTNPPAARPRFVAVPSKRAADAPLVIPAGTPSEVVSPLILGMVSGTKVVRAANGMSYTIENRTLVPVRETSARLPDDVSRKLAATALKAMATNTAFTPNKSLKIPDVTGADGNKYNVGGRVQDPAPVAARPKSSSVPDSLQIPTDLLPSKTRPARYAISQRDIIVDGYKLHELVTDHGSVMYTLRIPGSSLNAVYEPDRYGRIIRRR